MFSNNEAPYQFSEQSSNCLTDFDYTALESETRIIVEQHTYEIKSLMRRTASDIIYIGQKLKEVKEQLGHGYFRRWLKVEFDWGIWTATKFMQVADKFKCVKITHLDIAPSALYELAAPSTPEAARGEAIDRANCGETITHSKAKAIKAKAIARQHKQTHDFQSKEPVTINVNAETVNKSLVTTSQQEVTQHLNPMREKQAVAVDKVDNQLVAREKQQIPRIEEADSYSSDLKSSSLDEESRTLLVSNSTDVNKIYTKFIDSVEDLNIDTLHSIEVPKLQCLINASELLIKRAKSSLSVRQQT